MRDKKIIFIILAIIIIESIIFLATLSNKEKDNYKYEVNKNENGLQVERDENIDATNIMKEMQDNINKIKQ